MANFRKANYLDHTVASGEVAVKGYPFRVGSNVGVCGNTAAEGAEVKLWLEGIWLDSPKTTGTAWTQGQRLYWKASTSKYSTLPADGFYVGTAAADAASAATTGEVMVGVPEMGGERFGIATLGSGTVNVADTRVSATSLIFVSYNTASTKGATLLAVVDPGVKITISAIKEADGLVEGSQVGTVAYHIVY